MPAYYCCSKEDNTCELKDTCERYLTDDVGTTLFKAACIDKNGHVLYMEKKEELTNGTEGNGEPSESLQDE